MTAFWPIVIQILLAVALALTILAVSHLLGQRGHPNKIKDSPYECGVETHETPIGPFSIKFYRVALLFIATDVALALLLPWAMSFKPALAAGVSILVPGVVFLLTISLGVAYQIQSGVLSWEE